MLNLQNHDNVERTYVSFRFFPYWKWSSPDDLFKTEKKYNVSSTSFSRRFQFEVIRFSYIIKLNVYACEREREREKQEGGRKS